MTWISISDRLPRKDEEVFAVAGTDCVTGENCLATDYIYCHPTNRNPYRGWCRIVAACQCKHLPEIEVTHWMPAPELPDG